MFRDFFQILKLNGYSAIYFMEPSGEKLSNLRKPGRIAENPLVCLAGHTALAKRAFQVDVHYIELTPTDVRGDQVMGSFEVSIPFLFVENRNISI